MRSLLASTGVAATLLLSVTVYGGSDVADSTLIEFELEDQFERKHTDAEYHDRTLIVVGSDRHSSQFSEAWTSSIHDSLDSVGGMDNISIVEIADVHGVPFFVKGKVRGSFSKDSTQWVLLDWKGKFPQAYKWEKDMVNILVFDSAGRLMHQVSATSLEPIILTEIVLAATGDSGPKTGELEYDTAKGAVPEGASTASDNEQGADRK